MSPFHRPALRTEWRPDRWGALRCVAVRDETQDVKTFVLSPVDGARLIYEAGQFMTFRAELAGEMVERCYTLSSSAAGERCVEITVKHKVGGVFSKHLFASLCAGAQIEAFGPAGRFGPAALPAHRYAFIAAGSGVTPMLSIVRTAADLGIDLDAVYLQVARHPQEMIAGADLLPLQRRLPRLKVVQVASTAPKRWRGGVGRVDGARLQALVPDLSERAVLCCGPDGFMAAMRDGAVAAGVPADRYMEETFDFGTLEAAQVLGDGPARRITFARSGRSFECADGLTILQAARDAGIPIAASCARGMCGTCKSMMLSGEVSMDHNGGIRDREVARGFVLPCSARPTTDVVLDR